MNAKKKEPVRKSVAKKAAMPKVAAKKAPAKKAPAKKAAGNAAAAKKMPKKASKKKAPVEVLAASEPIEIIKPAEAAPPVSHPVTNSTIKTNGRLNDSNFVRFIKVEASVNGAVKTTGSFINGNRTWSATGVKNAFISSTNTNKLKVTVSWETRMGGVVVPRTLDSAERQFFGKNP